MIKFIKNLLGLNKPTETVKEILTPPVVEPKQTWTSVEVKAITPKPVNKKVKAISVPATATNTKPKANPAVTEGNTKGGNNVVKLQPTQSNKPKAPGKPKARRK